MPVVNVRKSSLSASFPGIELDEIIEKLPYVGLDIEGTDEDSGIIKVEFNPNRPDYSSEKGILRALKGLLEREMGLPIIKCVENTDYAIGINDAVADIRPVICGFVAKRQDPLNEYEISQLISMQEDLHNGIGRKRKKSSIGLHDLDSILFPLSYTTVSKQFSFIPLGEQIEFTVGDILNGFEVGKEYGYIVNKGPRYPMLIDAQKNVLSFPPIINGNLTKITFNTKNLLVEVTATSNKSAQDILSILSFELYDMGFSIFSVSIKSPFGDQTKTPNLNPLKLMASVDYVNKVLGLDLSGEDLIKSLEKSRCSGKIMGDNVECCIPRYRIDIFHPIDIAEEVAIGYGIYRLNTSTPSISLSGNKNINSLIFNSIREVLIGLGFIEIINTDIISRKILNDFFIKGQNNNLLSIADSKNFDPEVLRNSIIPSMMMTLSKNIHEKYPQKLFEIGKTFQIKNSILKEEWSLGVVIAHNDTDYTEIKSTLESLIKYCFNKSIKTPKVNFKHYLEGHSAKILYDGNDVGDLGEIYPKVIENFKLRTLVSVFQINLDLLMGMLNLKKLKYL
jgi:phenylalanyl-tRNA synthetase beta chain